MKYLKPSFSFLAMLIMVSAAQAVTLPQLAGTYKATPEGLPFPVENIVSIDQNGEIQLVEKSVLGEMNCSGVASLEGGILKSQMNCSNGQQFEQRINLGDVKEDQLSSFTAAVYSSLYGIEVPTKFEKVD